MLTNRVKEQYRRRGKEWFLSVFGLAGWTMLAFSPELNTIALVLLKASNCGVQ